MLVLLPLVAGHLFLRAEREQFLFARQTHRHGTTEAKVRTEKDEFCATMSTPCDCRAEGCGWSSRDSACVEGGSTDCLECPNPLICGDETCMLTILEDPDVVKAQLLGEACLNDGNDMAVCLCDPTIGDVLAAKLHEHGCCDANEMFNQMCTERRCMDVPVPDENGLRLKDADFCHKIAEPCECGIQPGCGWVSESATCEPGGATNCSHCSHSMLCSKTDTRCSAQLFKNPDFLGAINRAKVCMESGRDTVDECIVKEGGDLKQFVKDVQINGAETDCCNENKYFAMICEPPPERPKLPAGEGPCTDAADCHEGLVCEAEGDGVCMKPGDGVGPCSADGDCRDGLVCEAEGDGVCTAPLKKAGEPCEETGDCEEGLTCGEGEVCQKPPGKEGEDCSEEAPCDEGLTCGESAKCEVPATPLAKVGEPCSEEAPCEDGLTCGEEAKCEKPLAKEGEDCSEEAPCDSGLTCDAEAAKCEVPETPLAKVGEPCSEEAPCEDGLTCGEEAKCETPTAQEGEDCSESVPCEAGLACGEEAVCEVAEATTTSTTTSFFDIMKAMEKIARQSGLVTTTPAPTTTPEPPAEEAPAEEATAGETINELNANAAAAHAQTAASIESTEAANEEPVEPRKVGESNGPEQMAKAR